MYLHRPMLVAVVEHVAEFARGAGMVGQLRSFRVCATTIQALSAAQLLACWRSCAGKTRCLCTGIIAWRAGALHGEAGMRAH